MERLCWPELSTKTDEEAETCFLPYCFQGLNSKCGNEISIAMSIIYYKR